MLTEQILEATVAAFNRRRFAQAAELAAQGCQAAQGRDEVFWRGLEQMCRGFAFVLAGQFPASEPHLVAAIEKLRTFGFRYQNFDVPVALAGLRRVLEEGREVSAGRKRTFDVTLLPALRLAARADL